MKKRVIVFIFMLFLLSAPAFKNVEAEDLTVSSTFYEGYTKFAYDSFIEVNDDDNLLYSPVSFFYVLMMLYSFSNNDLEIDFENYFGFSKEDMLLEIERFTSDISIPTEDGTFWFQNFVYYDNSPYLYNVPLLEQNQTSFLYELGEYEFSNGDASRMLIDKIREGTEGFLQLTEQDLQYLLTQSIVINNTIYYEGIWKELFDEESNFEGDFFLSDGSINTVTYMTKESNSSMYYQTDLAKVARIFMNDGASFAFIVPNEEYQLSDVLEDSSFLKSLLSDTTLFYSQHLYLTLPKFGITSRIGLEETVDELGLGKMFTPNIGSFEGFAEDPNFVISAIEQISKIDVNEEGARIVSATFSVGCAAAAPPMMFTIDQPFFFVVYSTNDVPLFIGVIHDLGVEKTTSTE